jgi:hypothetical protein
MEYDKACSMFSYQFPYKPLQQNQDCSVSILTRLWAVQLGKWDFIPGKGRDFSLFHSIQISPVAHQTSYPMVTGGPFPGGKVITALS